VPPPLLLICIIFTSVFFAYRKTNVDESPAPQTKDETETFLHSRQEKTVGKCFFHRASITPRNIFENEYRDSIAVNTIK